MSSSNSFTNIWPAVNIYIIGGLLLLITQADIPVHGKANKLFHQFNTLWIACLVVRSTLLPLVVLVCWLVVPVSTLVVPVVLSIGLFITDLRLLKILLFSYQRHANADLKNLPICLCPTCLSPYENNTLKISHS